MSANTITKAKGHCVGCIALLSVWRDSKGVKSPEADRDIDRHLAEAHGIRQVEA